VVIIGMNSKNFRRNCNKSDRVEYEGDMLVSSQVQRGPATREESQLGQLL